MANVSARSFTKRGLQHPAALLTVANGLDLGRVHQAPEVVLVVGAVQAQAEPRPRQAHHRGDAGGRGVARVLSLQFHAGFELIHGRRKALEGSLI